MLLKISRDIKRLNKDFDSFNEEELRRSLTEIEDKITKTLNSKGFLPNERYGYRSIRTGKRTKKGSSPKQWVVNL